MPKTTEICNLTTGQSIYRVAREIKKQEHSTFNCLCSIAEDAAFVNEIRVLYPDLPLVANLRCGLWYTTHPASTATCYFKSTDGHQNTLNFSTTRLNWHIAELAAKRGGVLIVDATRKGKRFPDSLSKTIPIWAAVLNRAIARVRLHDAHKEQRRRSYATFNGEVLTPVADTQASISVRQGNDSSRPTCSSAAFAAGEPEPQRVCQTAQLGDRLPTKQRQPQHPQHAACHAHHSNETHVANLLVDCMADSMELLSGLTVAVQRPSTPELLPNHSSSSQHPQHQQAVAANRLGLLDAVGLAMDGPTGSPVGRSNSGLQRTMSLLISPQPSLQEWLDKTNMLHRLTAAALHHEHSLPRSKRAARSSCHSIIGANSGSRECAVAACAEALFASSAPAVSCLLSPASSQGGSAQSVYKGIEAANLQPLIQQKPATAAPGFSLVSCSSVEPITPRLGCCGALPATFNDIQAAVQQPAAPPAKAVPAAGGHNRRSGPHAWEDDLTPVICASVPPATSPLNEASTVIEFAFPPAHLLAQSTSLLHCPSDCSPASTNGGSSCSGSSLVAPNMPVVVLNGTSHQPADAAGILDIWRGTDLEDVATLPGIIDLVPGVYHIPSRQLSMDDDLTQPECDWQHEVSTSSGEGQKEEMVFQDCQEVPAAVTAASTALASTGNSSSIWWVDEEGSLGSDGLLASALLSEPAAAAPCAGSSLNDSDEQQRPRSRSACSDDSSDSSCSRLSCGSHVAAAAAGRDCGEESWDTSLHLPLWVPANERQAIEAKLDGFVERLLEVGADVRGLAAQLQKPLRPLWLSQDSLIWTNQVAHPSSLPFTPLLLISASQPHQCERQVTRAVWQQPVHDGNGTDAAAGASSDLDAASDEEEPSRCGRGVRSKASRAGSTNKAAAASGVDNKGGHSSWSYVYVPGAGDDEESWAGGLTPALFWNNCTALLKCGPAGVLPAAKQLVQQHRNFAGGGVGIRSTRISTTWQRHQQQCRPAGCKARYSVPYDEHHPVPQGCMSGIGQAAVQAVPAAPGVFWLGDTGLALGNLKGAAAADVWRAVDAVLCCGSSVPAVLQPEHRAMQMSTGCMPATPTSAMLSSSAPTAASLAQASESTTADATLCFKPTYWLCSHESSSSYSSCSDWAKQQQSLPQHAAMPAAASVEGSSHLELSRLTVHSAPGAQPKKKSGMLAELLKKSKAAQQAPVPQHHRTCSADSVSSCSSSTNSDGQGSSCCSVSARISNSSSSYGSCSEVSLPADGGTAVAGSPSLKRLKWLPVESAKRNRLSLKQQLQEALEFVSAHLAAGHLVLLHDAQGDDICVCVAVATLLACFSSSEGTLDAAASSAVKFVAAWPADDDSLVEQIAAEGQAQHFIPLRPVTKHSVRQQLAFVSAAYPHARPTRAMLKQVFNFFEDRRRAAVGVVPGLERPGLPVESLPAMPPAGCAS